MTFLPRQAAFAKIPSARCQNGDRKVRPQNRPQTTANGTLFFCPFIRSRAEPTPGDCARVPEQVSIVLRVDPLAKCRGRIPHTFTPARIRYLPLGAVMRPSAVPTRRPRLLQPKPAKPEPNRLK